MIQYIMTCCRLSSYCYVNTKITSQASLPGPGQQGRSDTLKYTVPEVSSLSSQGSACALSAVIVSVCSVEPSEAVCVCVWGGGGGGSECVCVWGECM